MPTIHNPTIRQFNMPSRAEEGRKILRPNSKLEVSKSYLHALFAEENSRGQPTGWAVRLEKTPQGARVKGPTGVAGTFEARVQAYREASRRKVDEAKVRAEEAEQKNRDLERRLADLEGRDRKRKADPPKGDEGKPAESKGEDPPKGDGKPDDAGQTKPGVGSEPKSGGGKGGGKKS